MFYDWNKINGKRGQMGLFDRVDGGYDIAIKLLKIYMKLDVLLNKGVHTAKRTNSSI
jgi:hypothetical protein